MLSFLRVQIWTVQRRGFSAPFELKAGKIAFDLFVEHSNSVQHHRAAWRKKSGKKQLQASPRRFGKAENVVYAHTFFLAYIYSRIGPYRLLLLCETKNNPSLTKYFPSNLRSTPPREMGIEFTVNKATRGAYSLAGGGNNRQGVAMCIKHEWMNLAV